MMLLSAPGVNVTVPLVGCGSEGQVITSAAVFQCNEHDTVKLFKYCKHY